MRRMTLHKIAWAVLLGAVSACSSPSSAKPTEEEIDKVEELLAVHPCVGDLSKWRRTYVYMANYSEAEFVAAEEEGRPMRPVSYDTRLIEFILQPAGDDVKAGRTSATDYPEWIQSDNSLQPSHLFGGYAIPLNNLNLECDAPPPP